MALLHPMHLALVALVVLLVFGPRKLPELARGLGQRRSRLRRMGRCMARHVWLTALAAALTIGLSTAAAVWWAQGAAARSAAEEFQAPSTVAACPC